MKDIFRTGFLILILIGVIFLGYFSFVNSYGKSLIVSALVFFAMIFYHLQFDKPRSELLLSVLIFFILSNVCSIYFFYTESKPQLLVYVIQILVIFGFYLILREIFRETKIVGIVVNKYSWLIFLIILVDIVVIYKILGFIREYQLGLNHLVFGFIFTIIKMLLLSAGLISYFASIFKSRKVSFLNASLAAFLASDIIDASNYLFFTDNPIPAVLFLQSGLSMIGVLLFYVYCVYPNTLTNNEVILK